MYMYTYTCVYIYIYIHSWALLLKGQKGGGAVCVAHHCTNMINHYH